MHYSVPNLDKRIFMDHIYSSSEKMTVRDTTNNIAAKVIFTEQVVRNIKNICSK